MMGILIVSSQLVTTMDLSALYSVCIWQEGKGGEREKERQRETDRQRQRETERKIDRQKDSERETVTETGRERQ